MYKAFLIGVAVIAVMVWAAVIVVNAGGDAPGKVESGVPWPSATEGHHGGELASESYYRNSSSFLQNGSDAQNDDYLVVCDNSNNGNPSRGGIYDSANGWFYVSDGYKSGCTGREYGFNAEGHNINGHSYSSH